jgi:hypothetical protein
MLGEAGPLAAGVVVRAGEGAPAAAWPVAVPGAPLGLAAGGFPDRAGRVARVAFPLEAALCDRRRAIAGLRPLPVVRALRVADAFMVK